MLSNRARAWVWSAVILALVPVTGCGLGNRSSAMSFNEALVKANKELETAGLRLGQAIAPFIQRQPINREELTAARDNANAVMTKVRNDMAALTVPELDGAPELYAVHQKFLDGQEKLIKEINAIVNQVLANTAQAGDCLKRIQKIETTEKASLTELQKAQGDFARKNGIKLQ